MMSSSGNPFLNQQTDLQQFVVGRRPAHLYYKLHRKALLMFSIFNFFWWTLSTALQVKMSLHSLFTVKCNHVLQVFGIALANGITYYRQPTYTSTSTSLSHSHYNYGDSASLGIWCAIFYMLTAFLGYSATYTPAKKL